MKRLIAIIGEPAVGKTELAKALRKKLGLGIDYKHGRLRATKFKDVHFLGVYDGQGTFQGTDRLSMAVQADMAGFLKTLPSDAVVIFEGDRLTRESFFKTLDKKKLTIFYINCSDQEKERRRTARGGADKAKFIQGRATMLNNILLRWPVTKLQNENEDDARQNTETIFETILK